MLKGDRDCRMSIDIFHPVKAQHYIPRHYLSAWARRKGKRIDLIWVRIKGGEVFETRTKNIGQRKYLYAYPDLKPDEFAFVVNFLSRRTDLDGEVVRSIYQGGLFIPTYLRCLNGEKSNDLKTRIELLVKQNILEDIEKSALAFAYNHIMRDLKTSPAIAEIIRLTKIAKANGFEHYMTEIENRFNPLLDKARMGDLSFMSILGAKAVFIHGIINQLLRTGKYDEHCKQCDEGRIGTSESLLRFMRHQSAFDIASQMIQYGGDYELNLIENNTGLEFITGDQPVCTMGHGRSICELDLYYPISPSKALCLTKKGRFRQLYNHLKAPMVHDVDQLNKLICHFSIDQLYAKSGNTLEIGRYYASKW